LAYAFQTELDSSHRAVPLSGFQRLFPGGISYLENRAPHDCENEDYAQQNYEHIAFDSPIVNWRFRPPPV
jgi:hypothetical protein